MKTSLAATLSRSAVLLEAASGSEGLQFTDALAALGAVPSTVARLLRGLTDAELLSHDADGRYRTTVRLQRLAAPAGGAGLEAEAARTAERLAAGSGQSAAVFTPVADGVRMLAKCEPPERFRYMPVGGINRDCRGHGFCLLRAAWWTRAEARRRAGDLPGAAIGLDWLERLPALRRQGWLVRVEDDQAGLGRIVAACLRADGELLAVVGVTATSAAIAARRRQLLEEVRAAAAALAGACGGRP